jgi:hypothetical protein
MSTRIPGPGPVTRTCSLLITLLLAALAHASGDDKFARTHSQGQYVHRIHLYDQAKQVIDPADPKAPPYSPVTTCGKCHDYKSMAHGWHFNAADLSVPSGRRGEPWMLVDRRSGTQLPITSRDWPNAFKPADVGLSPYKFTELFGRHMPGGGHGEPADPAQADTPDSRWKLSGSLAIDCMICHGDNRSFDHETWAQQISLQNFAWASTAALGLAQIDGAVSRLPADFDPANPPAGKTLPVTKYDTRQFDFDKKVFFDVVRRPPNNNCYYCHTQRPVGPTVESDWNHDTDVHIRAGMSCVDCHRNGIGHETVRGYEGEEPREGLSVASLSCAGCHIGEHDDHGKSPQLSLAGGRLGAPKPRHAGIPPLHFKELSCTACHSGPAPESTAGLVQTSLAHQLGLPSHDHADLNPPVIAQPVFMRDKAQGGLITPHRMTWPAYWGRMVDGKVTPIHPDAAYTAIRSALRIRKDFSLELSDVKLAAADRAAVLGEERAKVKEEELTADEKAKLTELTQKKAAEAFREKLPKALEAIAKTGEGKPVYISGGKLYQIGDDGKLAIVDGHAAAQPYSWPLGHNVRPARQSLGADGRCIDCHAPDAKFTNMTVAALGPAPDDKPPTSSMKSYLGLEGTLWTIWEQSFAGRSAFKIMSIVISGVLGLAVLMAALKALSGVSQWLNRSQS